MKKLIIYIVAFSALFIVGCSNASAKKAPRKIAVQTWTFHKNTLVETIEMLKTTPVRALEIYPGMKIGGKYPNVRFTEWMNPEQRAYVKELLAKDGFKVIGYGVTNCTTEKGIRIMCRFAQEFGIKAISTETKKEHLPLWDRVLNDYPDVKLVIHCHQKGSGNDYYNPEVVMDLIKDTKNVGVCADNGAWATSGVDNVKAFKTVKDKLIEIHFKDIKEFGKLNSPTVIYGTGSLPLKEILAELDAQGYDGYFIIEDGSAAGNDPLGNVKKSVEYLLNN